MNRYGGSDTNAVALPVISIERANSKTDENYMEKPSLLY
jgi:hypothetical protein